MRRIPIFFVLFILFGACTSQFPITDIDEENWSKRAVDLPDTDSLIYGQSYLSVYSQMYSFTQKKKYNLTGMISIRNVSESDTIYLTRADYYDTSGERIRTYFDYPIFVKPMETLEIVIAQDDIEGGTGSNFLFDWSIPLNCSEPLFEGVMNSMQGKQGVSFTTQGRKIE
ncbi:MAG TPA: DUF3124 domain-containing protein [Saprospiraceae bacterium]|nr:DUF3124 domain-containing protein [Saprospiraceae bacterium]